MFSTLFTIALLASSALAEFSISTPTFVQCQSAAISWTASTAPYNLIVVAADDQCGDALADLGDHSSTSIHWNVTLPAGAVVTLSLEDADGNEAWSGDITVGSSDDTSCLDSAILAAVSSDSAYASSTASSTKAATTLVVTPTTTVNAAAATSDVPSAVGAAASEPLLGNGALSARQGTPILVLGALAAVLAFSL
ncbi:hypothetical protein H0H92_005193 [Tricholoma furcatifolium]|nr:hypothetical protein H0H92_005193 [Tricholoma furcatifolium]